MKVPAPGNKYIIGWMTLREGAQAEFDSLVAPYAAACRAEPECRFFEMLRKADDPRAVLICECFESEAAHGVHVARPHAQAFLGQLPRLALACHFENVIAQSVSPDAFDFSGAQAV
jgi:quinol monooxygenase YgiN